MPKYDFKCQDCEHKFEVLTSPAHLKKVKCLKCGSNKTQKLLSVPAIILKGSGFYKTDTSKHSCSTGSCSACGS